MITFILLLIALLVLAFVSVIAISIGGAGIIIVFGDVIICILLIVWIVKRIKNRKK